MPLLRDYIAEHERAINLGGDAVRAIDCDELAKAAELLGAMAAELRTHWQGEERGLFAVMGRDELYAEHIDPLVREHRDLEALLSAVTSPTRPTGTAFAPRSSNCTSTSPRRRTASSPHH
jgi:iron-sulfur cluster repair protein YtfE (RIC family)